MDSLIERYQIIYQKDPQSKVFAPLCEAYRKMGLLKEAIELAESGVKKHPHFASGRVALGKALMEKGDYQKAAEHLKQACDLAPENILAHQMLSECYLKLHRKTEAMQSAKMVLFLNPQDKKMADVVKNLERDVFSTPESGTEAFAMKKLGELKKTEPPSPPPLETTNATNLDRELALLDARFDRGQWNEAKEHLNKLFKEFPLDPRIEEKKKKLQKIESGDLFNAQEWITPIETQTAPVVIKLQALLKKVQERRKS